MKYARSPCTKSGLYKQLRRKPIYFLLVRFHSDQILLLVVSFYSDQILLLQIPQVKFTMQFRGREMTHANVGKDVLMKMANELEEYGTLDSTPKVQPILFITFSNYKAKPF